MAADRVAFEPSIISGALISGSDNATIPGGFLGRDIASANSSGTLSTEVIDSVTVTVGDNRALLLIACVTVRSDLAGGAQAAIFEDSIQIQRKNIDVLESGTDYSWTVVGFSLPAAGSHLYELVTGVSGGAGNTVTAIADGAAGVHGTNMLLVIDLGPAF